MAKSASQKFLSECSPCSVDWMPMMTSSSTKKSWRKWLPKWVAQVVVVEMAALAAVVEAAAVKPDVEAVVEEAAKVELAVAEEVAKVEPAAVNGPSDLLVATTEINKQFCDRLGSSVAIFRK
jgi:hypothetical protein